MDEYVDQQPNKTPDSENQKIKEMVESTLDLQELSERVGPPFNKQALTDLAFLVVKLDEKPGGIEQYDTLVSDEASGRIPTKILKRIIDSKREGEGLPKCQDTYVNGGAVMGTHNPEWNENARRALGIFFERNKPKMGRTLLVTEYIASGRKIRRLSSVMDEKGIDFDIASASTENAPNDLPPQVAGKLTYGNVGLSGAAFYDKALLTGIQKDLIFKSVELSNKTGFTVDSCARALQTSDTYSDEEAIELLEKWVQEPDAKEKNIVRVPPEDMDEEFRQRNLERLAHPLHFHFANPDVIKQTNRKIDIVAGELTKLVKPGS